MTQLDEQVVILFERMIQSWDKFKNIEDGHIEFDNGLQIYACKKSTKHDKDSRENEPLRLDKNTFSRPFFGAWDTIFPDTDKMLFYINTPYRQYKVPEHDRHEYVRILDILDDSIHKFEEKKMKEYITHFKVNE